jgi:hypothetical protein
MTERELAEVIAGAVKTAVKTQFERLTARVDELEGRAAGQRYCGIWDGQQEYRPGNTATWDGSTWHCNCTTRAKPGVNGDWTLCVKRGKDGRDGKDLR